MLKIIYASITGNTENICRKIFELIESKNVFESVEIFSADEVDSTVFNKEDSFIIGTSTWNLGQMNQNLENLYDQIEKTDLSDVKIAFVGLGDSVYGEENYNKSMLDFRERAIKSGAKEICNPLKIDGDPSLVIDTEVTDWVSLFANSVSK